MIKLSDYVAQFLVDHGLTQVFMVTGGGAMHLNDSLGHHEGLTVVMNHHEQACAMAAEGYARMTNRPAVVNVTTGPGGINAMNGVFGAWTDSIPMLVISGQVKRETCMASYPELHVRQLGDQEADIISMAKGITKYAALVKDPATIRYHLEKALHLATTGRQGPCWLDIPIDVQVSKIPGDLPGYEPVEETCSEGGKDLDRICGDIAERIGKASRPVIMVGKGVRQSGGEAIFEDIIRRLGVPVVTAWTGIDMMASDDPLYCGRPGDLGDRAGNFVVQNADLLLILGTRLGLRQVSYNWKSFSRESYKIQVDVDAAEFRKPTVSIDLPVHCDLKEFLPRFQACLQKRTSPVGAFKEWLAWGKERVNRYPVVQPHHRKLNGDLINPYHFMSELYAALSEGDAVVCGNGSANVIGFQAAVIRKGQRVFCNTGDASMGFGLPAAIGAAVAGGGGRVVCLEGDGSIMMNLQELQTLALHGWPLKLFVLNNSGYLSIRLSQSNFFRRLTGESAESGLSFPDFERLGRAFGLRTCRAAGSDFSSAIRHTLSGPDPVLCEVMLDPDQGFEPKLAARTLPDGRIVSPPLEDMFPFLSRSELKDNLYVKSVE